MLMIRGHAKPSPDWLVRHGKKIIVLVAYLRSSCLCLRTTTVLQGALEPKFLDQVTMLDPSARLKCEQMSSSTENLSLKTTLRVS